MHTCCRDFFESVFFHKRWTESYRKYFTRRAGVFQQSHKKNCKNKWFLWKDFWIGYFYTEFLCWVISRGALEQNKTWFSDKKGLNVRKYSYQPFQNSTFQKIIHLQGKNYTACIVFKCLLLRPVLKW